MPFHIKPAIAIILLFSACAKAVVNEEQSVGTEKHFSKKQGKNESDIVFNQQNLFPEGVVYDKFNNRFYVSSTNGGNIGIVSAYGQYTPFITGLATDATTGLEIDEARKLLYVAYARGGAVGVFNIADGSLVRTVDLSQLLKGKPAFINDITIDEKGNAFVTNSFAPEIYRITPKGQVSLFYSENEYATAGFGFNGIEYANQGFLLVAFTSGNAIVKIPVNDPSHNSRVQLDAPLANPDGLLLNTNGKELVVVNNAGGQDGKVLVFASKDKWKTGYVTSTTFTGPVFPTTATTDKKNVWVLYAYLNRRNAGQNSYTIKNIPLAEKF